MYSKKSQIRYLICTYQTSITLEMSLMNNSMYIMHIYTYIYTCHIYIYKCTPCLANNRTLCCKQIIHTTTFRSNQTNRIFHIYHNLNCKSKYVIYLLECTNSKIQYVRKAETEFNIRLNCYTYKPSFFRQKP